jgi:hypothetical protein
MCGYDPLERHLQKCDSVIANWKATSSDTGKAECFAFADSQV